MNCTSNIFVRALCVPLWIVGCVLYFLYILSRGGERWKLISFILLFLRGSLKSPWSRRRKKHALLPKQWKNLFTPNGKLNDDGVEFLKKVQWSMLLTFVIRILSFTTYDDFWYLLILVLQLLDINHVLSDTGCWSEYTSWNVAVSSRYYFLLIFPYCLFFINFKSFQSCMAYRDRSFVADIGLYNLILSVAMRYWG